MNKPLAVGVAAACVWALGCFAIYPTLSWVSPFPSAVVVPAIWLQLGLGSSSLQSLVPFAASVPIALLFVLWSSHLFRNNAVLPGRSIALLAGLILLSAWDAYGSLFYGLRFQGFGQMLYVDIATALVLTGLVVLAAWARWAPSFRKNFAFHATLFAWLAWGALPLLGKIP